MSPALSPLAYPIAHRRRQLWVEKTRSVASSTLRQRLEWWSWGREKNLRTTVTIPFDIGEKLPSPGPLITRPIGKDLPPHSSSATRERRETRARPCTRGSGRSFSISALLIVSKTAVLGEARRPNHAKGLIHHVIDCSSGEGSTPPPDCCLNRHPYLAARCYWMACDLALY